jgi:flagellar FliL protein
MEIRGRERRINQPRNAALMQDLLSTLSTPIVVGLIVLVVVVLGVLVFLARRRRANQEPPADPMVSLGGPVDYTSLPLDEEPTGWRDRFARLSLAGKILAVLVPILAILGVVALILTLQPASTPAAAIPTPVPVSITVDDAAIIRAQPLTVDITAATTGLDDGATVTAEMLEDGQPFAWLNPEQVTGTVRRNRVEVLATRAEGAPTPTQGRRYTVVLKTADGTVSNEFDLLVPGVNRIAETFYGQVAAAPTATTAPTAASTPSASTPEPSPTVEPSPTGVVLPTGTTAGVTNGGNVRRLPIITGDNVVGGVNANENVQLIARTPNGLWYLVRTQRDELGWVSATLISVPAELSVPVAPVVTVFANGAVYERPDSASTELDRVNVDEVVQLKQKTADGAWYEVNNVRNIDGWVPAELLGIPDDVAASVPVAP